MELLQETLDTHRRHIGSILLFDLSEFFNTCNQLFLFDRLEQVINAIDFKCFDSILIVGGDKYNRTLYLHLLEYIKALPINQFYIH